MTEKAECVVIGAGVVGLAVARALSMKGVDVIVLEAADAIGTSTSSRNSEVIHSGIYYRNGSLKARLCLEGRRFLYDYCAARGIDHSRIRKLIVATEADNLGELDRLRNQGEGNGVGDLTQMDAGAARRMEPNLRCAGALFSPSTGIIDSHGLMLAYRGDAEDNGAMIAFGCPVTGGCVTADGIRLDVGGAASMRIEARLVVNAAGLQAHRVASAIDGVPGETVPMVHYTKGNYFSLRGKAPFGHLVYPTHERGLSSIHLTLDLRGRARFGPDTERIDDIDYRVAADKRQAFCEAIRRYWPELMSDRLEPDYSGIRPKLTTGASHAQDFVIQDERTHDVTGLVQLYGIESPGLTASAAIAAHVVELLRDVGSI